MTTSGVLSSYYSQLGLATQEKYQATLKQRLALMESGADANDPTIEWKFDQVEKTARRERDARNQYGRVANWFSYAAVAGFIALVCSGAVWLMRLSHPKKPALVAPPE